MSKHRHYLKIPATIAQYYPGIRPTAWREAIFADLTELGQAMTVETLPDNPSGARAALHGDRFYAEVGRDRDREDALFLIRINEVRHPRSVPQRFFGSFALWTGGDPPLLDSVDEVLGRSAKESLETEEASLASHYDEPSPRLLERLSDCPAELRNSWRPGEDSGPASVSDFLEPLRALWTRYRLDRLVELTPRQELLLRGTTPAQLGQKERNALITNFSFSLLNKLLLDEYVDLFGVIEQLSAAALPSDVRVRLWLSTFKGTDAPAIRRELYEVRSWLETVVEGDEDTRERLQALMIPHLRDIARDQGDQELALLLEGSYPGGSVMRALANWAVQLQFVDSQVTAEPVIESEYESSAEESVDSDQGKGTAVDLIDSWVLHLRGIDPVHLTELRAQLSDLTSRATVLCGATSTLATTIELTDLAQELAGVAQSWLKALPRASELNKDVREASSAYKTAHDSLGASIDLLLQGFTITPAELVDIVQLTERGDVLDQMPGWFWLLDDDAPDKVLTQPRDPLGYATAVLRPEIRARVRTLIGFVEELGEPVALRWIPAVALGLSVEEHLSRWFSEVREFLRAAPAEIVSLLKSGPIPGIDLHTLTQDLARRRHLEELLAPAVFKALDRHLTGVADLSQRSAHLAAFCEAVDLFATNFGDVTNASFDSLITQASKRLASYTGEGRAREAGRLILDHNWTETSATRATLVLAQPEPSVQYGVLVAPLVLETDTPREVTVRMKWDYRDIRSESGWPKEWPRPEPEEAVTIPIYRWQPQPEPSNYHYSFKAQFPVRVPTTETFRFEVSAAIYDEETGHELARQTLRWEAISLTPLRISLRWRDETAPEYVSEHPIGPQLRANAILERFKSGSSVAVLAPRRFGKSTLVEYLVKEGGAANMLVPPTIVCTSYASATGFDYQRLWGALSDQLQATVGAALERPQESLPGPKAFDFVRRAAKRQGFSAVVLLFDEAQLLFPRGDGRDVGSRLKTLLTNHWARTDDPKLVPVLIGLIALPSMHQRAGADLMGLLHPFEHLQMDESQLRPLIAKMAAGMQSTRGARNRLAKTSGNLLILRALLEKLASRLEREQKVWANYDDVIAVEEEMKQALQDGREETVASYIRDVLNGADRIDDWQPIPSYPTAVALALTRLPGHPFIEAMPRAVDQLNKWCRLNDRSNNILPKYDEALVKEHLKGLQESKVAEDSDFTSRLLEAWLRGVGRRVAFDDAFRETLFKGAHKRIIIPENAKKVATGGQAEIWRDGDRAYRVRVLSSTQERQAFLESADMLEALSGVFSRREIGSDHIFALLDMGLSSRGNHDAVQVYRWVPGEDLSNHKEALSSDAVLEIGVRLSRAVRLLHRHNILHRDICPRNVVLDNESDPDCLRPVLIDFGFAKLASTPMHTELMGEHSAPEVRGPQPQWSKSADIYALSSTLKWLLQRRRDSASSLADLLDRALAESITERPSADRFLEELVRLSEDHRLDERRNQKWVAILKAAGQAASSPWFSAQLRKSKPELLGIAMGFQATPLERFAALAHFLNQVSEGHPQGRSLKLLREKESQSQSDSVTTLWALRNHYSHAKGARFEETRTAVEEFRQLTRKVQLERFLKGARAVGQECGLSSLPAVVKAVMDE